MAEKSEASNWGRHLVNLWQTKEERREKYHLCRSLGCNASHAQRMKDWRLTKIERFFNLTPKSYLRADGKLILEPSS